MQITTGQWLGSSSFPQILTVSPEGEVDWWANNTGSGLGLATVITQGLARTNITMLDFDQDGRQDLLAKDYLGHLLLFRSDGMGHLVDEPRPVIGTGWNSMTEIAPVHGLGGPATSGVLGRSIGGQLTYYPLGTASSWGATKILGAGWSSTLVSAGEILTASPPYQEPRRLGLR